MGSAHSVSNGKPLRLNTTSDAQEVLNLSRPERQSTILITSDTERSYRTIVPSSNSNGSVIQTGVAASTRQDSRDAIIDIAIVMDESDSITSATLQAVADELSTKLADKLKGSDWNIAVTGSSKGSTYLKKLSSKDNNDDHAKTLHDYLVSVKKEGNRGTNYNNELMIDNAVKLINNQRWQRDNPDAQVVLLITDEDLQCVRNGKHTTNSSCEDDVNNRESERLSKNWKAKENNRSVFGIIKFTYRARQNYLRTCSGVNINCYKDTNSDVSVPHNGSGHLFDLIADISVKDFSSIMDALTEKVKQKLLTTKIPGKPFINHIAIGHKASDISNLVVKISGINNNNPLPPTLFTVSDYKITLNVASQADLQRLFPTGARLAVSYDIPDKNRSFAIPKPSVNADDKVLVDGSVAVQVNGSSVGFRVNGKFVTLNKAPPVNASLVITADYKAMVYDLAQQAYRIDGGNTACTKGNTTIACVHNRNRIRFKQSDQFAVGDKITATQMVDVLADNGEKLLTLHARYIKDSVQLEVGGKTCAHDQLLFDGNVINLSRSVSCPHLQNLTDQRIVVNYSQYDNTSSFNLDVPASMDTDDNWSVKVMIDNKELKAGEDYAIDRAKRTIHFLALESIDYDSEASLSYDTVE